MADDQTPTVNEPSPTPPSSPPPSTQPAVTISAPIATLPDVTAAIDAAINRGAPRIGVARGNQEGNISQDQLNEETETRRKRVMDRLQGFLEFAPQAGYRFKLFERTGANGKVDAVVMKLWPMAEGEDHTVVKGLVTK